MPVHYDRSVYEIVCNDYVMNEDKDNAMMRFIIEDTVSTVRKELLSYPDDVNLYKIIVKEKPAHKEKVKIQVDTINTYHPEYEDVIREYIENRLNNDEVWVYDAYESANIKHETNIIARHQNRAVKSLLSIGEIEKTINFYTYKKGPNFKQKKQ